MKKLILPLLLLASFIAFAQNTAEKVQDNASPKSINGFYMVNENDIYLSFIAIHNDEARVLINHYQAVQINKFSVEICSGNIIKLSGKYHTFKLKLTDQNDLQLISEVPTSIYSPCQGNIFKRCPYTPEAIRQKDKSFDNNFSLKDNCPDNWGKWFNAKTITSKDN